MIKESGPELVVELLLGQNLVGHSEVEVWKADTRVLKQCRVCKKKGK